MIDIRYIESKPLHEISYQYPLQGGRVAYGGFPIIRVHGVGLASGLKGLLAVSDMQGRDVEGITQSGKQRLLGELVAEELQLLGELGEVPAPENVGVLLAGDLYVDEDLGKRGGKGDVRDVWRAFRDRFRWVVGVPGNHDRFGEGIAPPREFLSEPGIHYLDPGVVELDGIRIGGVGGIVGNPSKPFRREQRCFLEALESVAIQAPDMIILHEGPSGRAPQRNGNEAIRNLLERLPRVLVICGHCHWNDHQKEELSNGTQILNAEARAYVIQSSEPTVGDPDKRRY